MKHNTPISIFHHQRKSFSIALIIVTVTILSVASYAAYWTISTTTTVGLSSRRQWFIRQAASSRSHNPLCSRSSSRSTPLLPTRHTRSLSSALSSSWLLGSSGPVLRPSAVVAGGDPPLFFPRLPRQQRRMTSSSSMSLSTDGRHAADGIDNFASYLNSVPVTLSNRIQNNGSTSKDNRAIHIIMGNEAGDADSIISALALGYVTQQEQTATMDEAEIIVAPIVSVPRADLSLRRDVVLLLDLAGIPMDNLLFVDDNIVVRNLLPLSSSDGSTSPLPRTTLTLVDHNRIKSSLSHPSNLVTEILDHHQDEASHTDAVPVDSDRRDIAFRDGRATVASTCTLVAERIAPPAGPTAARKIDRSLGLLLLGVILLDSVNMLPAAGKGTERDGAAMRTLVEATDWASYGGEATGTTAPSSLVDASTLRNVFPNGPRSEPDTTALFQVLSGAKNDPKFWYGLGVLDCLRIDYKKFIVAGTVSLEDNDGRDNDAAAVAVSSIGLSSVLIDMDSLLSKSHFLNDLMEFATSSDVGLFGIMAVDFKDGTPNRELLLAGASAQIVDSFADYLLHHPNAAFLEISERNECKQGDDDDDDDGTTSLNSMHIRVFQQGNGKGSRKQVAPILLGHAVTMSRL